MSLLKGMVVPVGVILLAAVLHGCAPLVPLQSPPPNAFAVFLCRASDVAATTHDADYYARFFATGPTDLLHDYFLQQSAGRGDVSGSRVFGWFSMAVSRDSLRSAVRNNSNPVTRTQTAQEVTTMEIQSGSIFFPRSRGSGPRTANAPPVVVSRQVLRAAAFLR